MCCAPPRGPESSWPPFNAFDMTTISDKYTLRTRLRARRLALPPDERAEVEAAIHARLFALPAWQEAPVICGYATTRGEINMEPIRRAAIAAGKRYALPVTLTGADEGLMAFRAIEHLSEPLPIGRYGIIEPPDTCPVLEVGDLSGALLIIPGLGFDPNGFRIGYGGGYYDRYIIALESAGLFPPPITVGLCFGACRVPSVPREAHDRAVDIIIDERSVTLAHELF